MIQMYFFILLYFNTIEGAFLDWTVGRGTTGQTAQI